MNKFLMFLSLVVLILTVTTPVLAHVVVKPNSVGVAERVNFAVSVPTEEDIPTTRLRLVIPEGLTSVRPNVKPGWNIQLVKTGEGEAAKISEIIWSGGQVPAEQRDEFVFSAQAPAEETSLNWQAYQTYSSGMVVAWEADPKAVEEYAKAHPPVDGVHDEMAPKPYSVTKVVNDLKATPAPAGETVVKSDKQDGGKMPVVLAGLALVLSALALGLQWRRK